MRWWSAAFLALGLSVSATCLYATPAPDRYVEGDVLVTLKPGLSLENSRQILSVHSLAWARYFPLLSQRRGRQTGLLRASGKTTAQLMDELKNEPAVETVEPNYIRPLTAMNPNDSLFSQLWGLHNSGQSIHGFQGTAGSDVKFNEAWTLARTSTQQVVVAVIDSGVDYHHPDLASNIWINSGEIAGNGLDDDGNGYVDDIRGWDFVSGTNDPSDSGLHGTHVAGTIAAVGNNELGVVGVCFRAKIMPLKTSPDGANIIDSAVIEAIQYATYMKLHGVNVVAMNGSFGGSGYDSAMAAAIQSAGDAGIIFCVAAGNNSANNDTTFFYPASFRLTNMLVVAASDANDDLASFSDYGASSVDLAAPGARILSTTPTNLPATIAYVQYGGTNFSGIALTYAGTSPGITGAVYNCGLGYVTDFPAAVNGNIALIARGTLLFADKVANAMAAGARAAIICNNAAGGFAGTLGSAGTWIPAVGIAQADGVAIQAALPGTGSVASFVDAGNFYQYLDGTSMATPHVSGAVAFAALNFPDETVTARIQRVLANVDPVPALQGKVATGGRLNLLRMVDTDRNGLPDWWEQVYFGRLTGTDPNADADGDGASNLAEWQAGTDPSNPASALRLHVQPVAGTNSLALTWPSVAGKTYRLESATNLTTGFNSIVRSNITGTPPLNTEFDRTSPSGATRFYRLCLEH